MYLCTPSPTKRVAGMYLQKIQTLNTPLIILTISYVFFKLQWMWAKTSVSRNWLAGNYKKTQAKLAYIDFH